MASRAFKVLTFLMNRLKLNDTDYSYKKFGFILLGNKSLNNVWKVQNWP